MKFPDKSKVMSALITQLSTAVEQAVQAAKASREGATHAEAKPENSKDTRALEQSYLARGQAMRVEELVEQIHVLRFLPLQTFGVDDAIGASALLMLESEEDTRCIFFSPYGGGIELFVDGVTVTVITPQSPLGALLLGRFEGDDIEQRVRGKLRQMSIIQVA